MFQTWMYVSAPLLLYGAERSVRVGRSEHYSVKVLKVYKLFDSLCVSLIGNCQIVCLCARMKAY